MTTIISLSHKTTTLETRVSNWSEVPENVKEFLLEADEVQFTFNEMLVYKDNKIVASCSTFGEIVTLEDCWTTEGNMWKMVTKTDVRKVLSVLRKQGVQAYIIGVKSEFSDDFEIFSKKMDKKGLDVAKISYVYATSFNTSHIYFNHDNGGAEAMVKVLDEMEIPYMWDGTDYTCLGIKFDKESV